MKNEEMALLFSEATPYIQKYHGKTMVIKYGGNAMINETLKNAVMNDLVTLTLLGVLASGPLLTLIRVPQEAYEQARTYCMVVLGGIGFMIGTGGTALVSKVLGEGETEKAKRYFTIWL